MKQSLVVGFLLSLSVIATGCRSLDPSRYPTPKEWHDEHHKDGFGSNGVDAESQGGARFVAWRAHG